MLSAFLALMTMMFVEGCSMYAASMKMGAVEQELSRGKVSREKVREIETGPSVTLGARKRLAVIVESVLKGDVSYGPVKADLEDIRDNPSVPPDLSVRAGYMLVLLERMEALSRQASRSGQIQKELEDLKRTLDQERKEKEELGKQLEEARFKLKKLEEIHMESLKRRGAK
ncbi:MAG TPA: hypothetical protein PLW83_04840 [Deltaproteobacteria bacterium]|nr:hypothetical protein [Deltaproteobacteria bacterium]